METKFGFKLLTVSEFETWIKDQNIARTILFIQEHHTFLPNYKHFNGGNHFDLQKGMKNHHVHTNGWSDIGQHFTIFPDGKIMTGRGLERSPACIFGNNRDAVCIENLGFFDHVEDQMTNAQKESIVKITALLCKRFNIPVTTDRIVYHHWFDLSTGARTNGSGVTKSCPGTNFFDGNTIEACKQHFLPLVANAAGQAISGSMASSLQKYGYVTTNRLNIRNGASSAFNRIGQTELGAILRIYEEKNNWYRISQNKEEWVYSNFVKDVKRATVNANILNVRSGPSTQFNVVGSALKNQEVFVYKEENNWSQISMDEQWVSNTFLDFVS
ncbi:SH3 domain-containing protein [Aquimarina sp. MMG016]|uniref:SH3 domain-containing protein n=1 Tax=Aquimarina sp. MMG016 TaxID=2822690 RepID=UPI001B39D4C8|nr:SH3 domain-containing protein [Aquimarina sp. MMG016]MBQ4820719.1 SH3 domain-containing protein [Aquimarina sp. MMG016]